MDAPEDNQDVKLYRASADLLPDIESLLVKVLAASDDKDAAYSPWIPVSQVQRLVNLLELFQEWPQLLDRILPRIINSLVEVFLRYITKGGHSSYQSQSAEAPSGHSLLPSAICCLLNVLCKVRGVKVVTRFLSNEPRYLEPMLQIILINQGLMTWQERYIVLLWLSHIALTPFDLASISFNGEQLSSQTELPASMALLSLPKIAIALLQVGLQNLSAPSKERESAARLLARFALRTDTRRLGLSEKLAQYAIARLCRLSDDPSASTYKCLGFLSVLSGLVKAGSADEVSAFLSDTVKFCLDAVTAPTASHILVRASAPARKSLLVILRTSALHAVSLGSDNDLNGLSQAARYEMIEETIQCLLEALADKDSPVRLAAAKALSMVCQKLDDDLKVEVTQAVLDSLEEDILYQRDGFGPLIPASQIREEAGHVYTRNLSAVNPLRWQGLLLTLGHLILRRSVSSDRLPQIIKPLLSALAFEQRTHSGSSVGASVRDAACFGLWSLARKYNTVELKDIDSRTATPEMPSHFTQTEKVSVLQLLANHLVVSSCLDPSGNIRRGSSAALQELVGRHPDTIIQGISLVQAVDYYAVARRSRAMQGVTLQASRQSRIYLNSLLDSLLGWRGIRAVDESSRRNAARAIFNLVALEPSPSLSKALGVLLHHLQSLPKDNHKTVADARHGLLLAFSHLVDLADDKSLVKDALILPSIRNAWTGITLDGLLLGNFGRKLVPDLVLEGAASVMASLAKALKDPLTLSDPVFSVFEICVARSEGSYSLSALGDAVHALVLQLPMQERVDLVSTWLQPQQRLQMLFYPKGRILALGRLFPLLPQEPESARLIGHGSKMAVLKRLKDLIEGDWNIETKVVSLTSLGTTIPYIRGPEIGELLYLGLDNYTNDQRGDVGALARLEAIKTVKILVNHIKGDEDSTVEAIGLQALVQRLFRLAGEKLDKVRFEAWMCLEEYFALLEVLPASRVSHVVDVSTEVYFTALLQYADLDWARPHVILGIAHSITSGSDDLVRLSRDALIYVLDPGRAYQIFITLIDLLSAQLQNDREVVPLLETIVFVLEQGLVINEDGSTEADMLRLFDIVRKAHFRSTNIRRLEAAVRIYAFLAQQKSLREKALRKLREMLLHPYPTIRNSVAEALNEVLPDELLLGQDWSRPPKELRPFVSKVGQDGVLTTWSRLDWIADVS